MKRSLSVSFGSMKPTLEQILNLQTYVNALLKRRVEVNFLPDHSLAFLCNEDFEGITQPEAAELMSAGKTANVWLDVHLWRGEDEDSDYAGSTLLHTLESCGVTVEHVGDGSGEYGPIICYLLTGAATCKLNLASPYSDDSSFVEPVEAEEEENED